MSQTNFVENAVGRMVPLEFDGKTYHPFAGAFASPPEEDKRRVGPRPGTILHPGEDCLVPTIRDAIRRIELQDGMTVSFHHHFREGDKVLNLVMAEIAAMGIKNLTLAPSSLYSVHEPLIEHIKSGVVTRIEGGSARGKVGRAISRGLMDHPIIIRSHGGRVRAIERGDLHIDAAFIGAPCADAIGNCNGVKGPSACGPLAYALADAIYGEKAVAVTDYMEETPVIPISISQEYVGTVVKIDDIGDPSQIASNTLQITRDPVNLNIARNAVRIIEASEAFHDGIRFQTGAGGISLAVTKFLGERMEKRGIRASFGMGGTTEHMVNLLEKGLLDKILTIQAFDQYAITSLMKDYNHIEVSAGFYANPHNRGTAVNLLDVVVLGATEVDLNFNVNVNTHSDGVLQYPTGGHSDTAAGAKLTIITAPLLRGRIPVVVDDVVVVSTPGETVDVLVTDHGIAVNPRRQDLVDRLTAARVPLKSIAELRDIAYGIAGKPQKPRFTDKIVALIEYRDGTLIDVLREVATKAG
ncbi:MAG: citrate lyase subunit alpha [Desulfobacterales bacterium]|jgi:citrate lyase subunit alpha/citrate CoA-transferase